MLNLSRPLNVTYHPILDNYKKYDNISDKTFNDYLKMQFAGQINPAYESCLRPCIDVSYTAAVDKFFFYPGEKTSITGCPEESGVFGLYFQRKMNYDLEDYIIKPVDLVSGFGGALGLWLGWSALSIGYLFIQFLKTLNNFTVLK